LEPSLPRASGVRYAGWATIGLLAALGPICYAAALLAASTLDRCAPAEAVCFDPAVTSHYAPVRLLAAAMTAVGAVLLLFVAPWILGTLAVARIEHRRATAGAWSLAVNCVALILVFALLRHTAGVGRPEFFAAWLAWTVVLALLAGKSSRCVADLRSLWRRWGGGILIGVAATAVGIVVFRREFFIQCFNGDGTEFSELARSLRYHFFLYYEIETLGRFGTFIANPTLINSYWTCAVQLLLGDTELATRLSYWIWWLGIFAVSLRIVQGRRGGRAWLPAIPLALLLLLMSVWYTFYVGYYPYMADPANPGVPDALFVLFFLLSCDCLLRRDPAAWVVLMTLSALVLYAGVVMFVLTAASAFLWRPVPRGQMARAALAGAALILAIAGSYLAVGWRQGVLDGWWSTLEMEYVTEYFAPQPRWRANLLFFGYLLLGCGVLPAIALPATFWKKNTSRDVAWDRMLATVALAYLLIIMGGGYKNLHYLGPLVPVPVILWLKGSQIATRPAWVQWAGPLSATALLAVCIVLCWPVSRPTFTLNRQLGAETTFQTDSYQEACIWGRITADLYNRGDLGWQLGQHTWASYSELNAQPAEPRALLITKGTAPSADYKFVLESADGVKLYCRDLDRLRWFASQRPSIGPDRCPRLFRPIAISPRRRGG